MIIFVHHIDLLITKKILFELNVDFNFSIYVYFVDIFTIFIFVRNNENQLIKIFKNFRFNRIFEINFFNVFYINNDKNIKLFIVKKLKFRY